MFYWSHRPPGTVWEVATWGTVRGSDHGEPVTRLISAVTCPRQHSTAAIPSSFSSLLRARRRPTTNIKGPAAPSCKHCACDRNVTSHLLNRAIAVFSASGETGHALRNSQRRRASFPARTEAHSKLQVACASQFIGVLLAYSREEPSDDGTTACRPSSGREVLGARAAGAQSSDSCTVLPAAGLRVKPLWRNKDFFPGLAGGETATAPPFPGNSREGAWAARWAQTGRRSQPHIGSQAS